MVCPPCLVKGISPTTYEEGSDTCAICSLESHSSVAPQESHKGILCEKLRSFVYVMQNQSKP